MMKWYLYFSLGWLNTNARTANGTQEDLEDLADN